MAHDASLPRRRGAQPALFPTRKDSVLYHNLQFVLMVPVSKMADASVAVFGVLAPRNWSMVDANPPSRQNVLTSSYSKGVNVFEKGRSVVQTDIHPRTVTVFLELHLYARQTHSSTGRPAPVDHQLVEEVHISMESVASRTQNHNVILASS
jgi:hypothetical protein